MQPHMSSRAVGVILVCALAPSCSSSSVRDLEADAGAGGSGPLLAGCETHVYAAKDYLFCQGKISWFEAKATCENLDGALAKLEDQYEAQFVEDTMEESWAKAHGGAWLGAQRVNSDFSGWKGRGDTLIATAGSGGTSSTSGSAGAGGTPSGGTAPTSRSFTLADKNTFAWLDGEQFVAAPAGGAFPYWSSGDPDGSSTGEDCLRMTHDGPWEDAPCNSEDNHSAYVCEL